MSSPPTVSGSSYEGLRFSFSDMEKEIENLKQLAKPFLEINSYEWILTKWKGELANFRSANPGSRRIWKIAEEHPVETNVSDGEYELQPRKGALKVFGRLSSEWEIHLPDETKKRGNPSRDFVLLGIASTKITIWTNDDPPNEIARWTIEVGDANSPGCHFHTQIDLDAGDHKFPNALCVPRFPGVLHTPTDALEFLLGELFQDRWLATASEGRDTVKAWANCQRRRLMNLLEWQRAKLSESSGSPWTMLKKQKPTLDMLMRSD
jgi:hypothetical protein